MSEQVLDAILKLSVEERLRIIDRIWESLDPGAVLLGDAHLKVIEERLAEHRRDPGSTLTLDEILAEARRAS